MIRCQSRAVSALLCGTLSFVSLISGCSHQQGAGDTPPPALAKHGVVQGGAHPISNSTIQLYAVGTAGDGSAATALLTQAVSTDANGEFDVTGSYSCPSASALVYVVAVGGNPGLAAGTNNSALTMMAVLGACGGVTASSPIYINELTTVAAVWALAPYMTSYSSVGSGPADAAAMADAFKLAAYYANTSTGAVPGLDVPAGTTVPVAEINTLADILASCVDTAGGAVGDGSACGTLFAASTPTGGATPVNVIAAGRNIADNPTVNIAGLFALVEAAAPYQPTLEGMPASLALGLSSMSGLSLSSGALTFPSTTVGVASAPLSIAITNTSAAAITLSGVSFSGAAASDFSVAAGCPATLAAGASCAVQVVFTPSVAGTRSASLMIASSAANSPLTVSLTGAGVAGSVTPPPSSNLSGSPSALMFPSATVGVASASLSVTVTNTGAAAITLSGASFSGAAASDFSVAGGCAATLAAGASCVVKVVFTPSVAGTRSASLLIASSAANSPLTVSLSGTGVAGGGGGTPPSSLYGHVEGGVQPVSNSAIQMYAVGTTGDGSAATALLTQQVSTDANGDFNIAGDYSCPSATSLVYVVAIGGNPGLVAGTNNTALTMMAALGACGNLTASTPIYVNELTTVAAVWALAPYMSSYSSIGSDSADAVALVNAFALASYYANPSTGTVPGLNVPAGTMVPVAEINTLADILATCVDSPGGSVGDGSACGTLFAATTLVGIAAPTNVISAGLNITNNPTANISSLYALVRPSAPFQPVLTTAPADWTVGLASSSTTSALSVEPSALSFPNIAVGETSAPVSVTVTNIGTSSIAMYGVSTIGSDAADFAQSTDCPGTLTPSMTCTVQVTFTPLAVGTRDASVSIVSGAPNSPQMVALSGAGVAGSAGPVTITPSTLTFYTPGVAQLLTLTNSGATPLSIGAIVFSSPNWTQVNNCGALLDAQSVCTIAVTAGATTGQFSGTLSMIDNDTTDAQTVSLTSKILSLSLGASQFPPTVIGSQPPVTPPIQYFGGIPEGSADGYYFWSDGGSFSDGNPGDFYAVGCNVKSMEPGQNLCPVSLYFQPTVAGLRTAYFTDYSNLIYFEEGFGIGSTPSFDISTVVNSFLPAVALDFGNHAVGSSTTLSLTVTNTSLVSLSFETPTLSGGASNNGDFQLLQPGCGVLQGFSGLDTQSCTLQIVFSPKVLGARSAMLTLTESSGISKQVLITGQGTYAAPIITPARLQFGNVQTGATSAPQTVTVVLPNQDAATAHLGNNPSSYHLSQNTSCARGASVCQFTLVFSPLATGETDDALLVTDLVTGYYSHIPLTGSGGIPTASLSSTMLTYSSRNVGVTSIPQTITLTNNGNVPLVLSAVGLGGSNASDFSIVSNTCGASVAVAASCAVSISFTPSAAGTRSASLSIQNNSASSPLVVPLTGTGAASGGTPPPSSSLSVSPSALTFPSATVGVASTPLSVTVTNTGASAITMSGTSFSGAAASDFSVAAGCSATLAVGASCTVQVVFIPSAAGTRSASLSISSSAANSPLTVSLTGTGVAAAPPPPVEYGHVEGGVQPVSGSAIQLYAVGTTGDGSAATALLTQPVSTDENGDFNIAGDYTCPSATSLVYVVAIGGNPGLAAGTNNTALTMMAALGACGNLTASTPIRINELTTVAAVWLLAPYMNSYSSIGSDAGDAAEIAEAFTLASYFVNPSTGTVPGLAVPAGWTVPVAQINTLADILASCVDTAGGVVGDGSACGTLFAAATPIGGTAPVDVIGAGRDIANNATENISTLFGLVTGTAPYQPTLTPSDLTLSLSPVLSLSASPSSLTFPSAPIGFPSTPLSITLTNTSTPNILVPITVGTVSLSGSAASDFLVVGSCPGSLAYGESCTIQVTFTPSAAGVRSATLSIPSNATNSPLTVSLTGTGVALAGGPVTLSLSSLTFNGVGAQDVIVTNTGAVPVSIGPITTQITGNSVLEGEVGPELGETNNCGTTLDAQSICTISVEAESAIVPGYTGTVTLVSSAAPGSQTISVNVLPSTAFFDGVPIMFGDVAVGTPASFELVVWAADGSLVPPSLGITITGPNASDFSVSDAGFGECVPLGCTATIFFTPSAAGLRTATAVTTYGNVPLSGIGTTGTGPNPFFTVASSYVDPNPNTPVGGSSNGQLSVTNSGTTNLLLSGVVTGLDPSSFTATPSQCSPLAPTQTCIFTITFKPLQPGVKAATLTITDSSSGFQRAVSLSGGISPTVTLTPTQLTFGNVQPGSVSEPQTVTVTTSDGGPVTVNEGERIFLISTGTCFLQTPCQLTVRFEPLSAGPLNSTVTVTPAMSTFGSGIGTLSLSGTSGMPAISLSTSSLTFDPHATGSTSISQTVTLTNTGNVALTISGMNFAGTNPGDFPIESNTCGSSVAAGASCTMAISFAPTATGARTANLQILSNAGSSPTVLQLSGTGS